MESIPEVSCLPTRPWCRLVDWPATLHCEMASCTASHSVQDWGGCQGHAWWRWDHSIDSFLMYVWNYPLHCVLCRWLFWYLFFIMERKHTVTELLVYWWSEIMCWSHFVYGWALDCEAMFKKHLLSSFLLLAALNYFQCKRVVELLKVSEADTRNIFGRYSSQRMRDWQDIMSRYEDNKVYLGELIYSRCTVGISSC